MDMQSFYQYMMSFRGKLQKDAVSDLADWMFQDLGFPIHASSYNEISDYLEWNSPFSEALVIFDQMWDQYTKDNE